jgi:predicted Zn-dependent peptidase
MTKRASTILAFLLAIHVSNAFGQTVVFKEYTLRNGLRVILSEDHHAPTYSIAVTYNVGSRDEKPGQTGYAHLFEHMMFQGSENVGKGEHFILIQNNGGSMNGTTSADRTNYYATLPSNQIDLGLFLEADRMRSLVINQANLDNQRETVKEERRQSYDNVPYGRTFEMLLSTAYDNFGYQHSTIGAMEDLDRATLKDIADFFRIYYAPNNAVLTMVGDFKSEEVIEKIRKYFEGIPRQTEPKPPDVTEPRQTAERRRTHDDAMAQLTRLDIAFKIPAGNTPDYYALDVAAMVLTSGQSSRLYQKLVKQLEIVQSVAGGTMETRGTSLFIIQATVRPGKDPAEVEKLIYAELERMKTEPVSDVEIQKVRSLVKRAQVEQLEGTIGRARNLGESTVFYNDPNLVNTFLSKYIAVTKAQLQKTAGTYLTQANRTVITTVPKPPVAPAGPGKEN